MNLLQAAVIGRRRVRLSYASGAGRRTQRLVDPWGMVDKDDVWYLLAGTERGQRTFRVDRIVAAEATSVIRARFEANAWFNLYVVGAGRKDLEGPLSFMHVK